MAGKSIAEIKAELREAERKIESDLRKYLSDYLIELIAIGELDLEKIIDELELDEDEIYLLEKKIKAAKKRLEKSNTDQQAFSR